MVGGLVAWQTVETVTNERTSVTAALVVIQPNLQRIRSQRRHIETLVDACHLRIRSCVSVGHN